MRSLANELLWFKVVLVPGVPGARSAQLKASLGASKRFGTKARASHLCRRGMPISWGSPTTCRQSEVAEACGARLEFSLALAASS